MKITRTGLNQAGNSLLVCLVATGVIGFTLAAYLTLVKSQNQSVVRSQVWNTTVSVIEAGMEEAMAHLNMHGSTNLLTDGWTKVGSKYIMERIVGDGYYNVVIDDWLPNTNCSPSIEARGFINNPLLLSSLEMPQPFVADANLRLTPDGKLGRGVKARVGMDSLFAKGLVAKGQINMNGNNVMTDSFDPLDPLASTGGAYDPAKAKANGDVATDSSLTNSVDVGNANIHGSVATGPKGTVKIGSGGSVSGKITDDMNVAFPPVTVPFASGWPTENRSAAMVSGTTYDYVYDGGNYKILNFNFGSTKQVLINGDCTIWAPNGFSLSGNATITIRPGAKLVLYVGNSAGSGVSGSITGNGGIINQNDSTRCIIYGLPTCTSLDLGGNASYTGCIYAPNADFSMNGGGSGGTSFDFSGGSITKTVTMNGHFNFHYDEALRKRGPARGFILTSWNEMTPAEVAAVPTIAH